MSPLFRIHLIRGVIAIAWSAAFAGVQHDLTAATVALLVLYPVIDVIASLADVRENRGTPARRLQIFNTGLSAATAAGLGLAAISGTGAVLFVFGLWAVIAGAAQVTVALNRRRVLGWQWPSLLAGTLSVIAGATYLPVALGDAPSLAMLVVYTAAGGTFFVLQAIGLAWRQRRLRVTTVN
ncbi:hypothetical protein [Actinoplanes sp. HUAS TT8]|uniref:hypothetical protein n=1 Tax=Actinoplanes sp. HUAS TT8 TaxID=3447453 RepID=UPI003F51BFD2